MRRREDGGQPGEQASSQCARRIMSVLTGGSSYLGRGGGADRLLRRQRGTHTISLFVPREHAPVRRRPGGSRRSTFRPSPTPTGSSSFARLDLVVLIPATAGRSPGPRSRRTGRTGDRYFLFGETGDLVIARLSPGGVRGGEPGEAAGPDQRGVRPEGGLEPPGVRGQVRVRPERQGDRRAARWRRGPVRAPAAAETGPTPGKKHS